MSQTDASVSQACQWCGAIHPTTVCPKVKAIDYFEDGRIKRVEFKTAADYGTPIPLGGQHVTAHLSADDLHALSRR